MEMPPDSGSPGSPEPEKEEGFWELVQQNQWDSCAYVLIFIGILVSIFERFIGELIIGTVFGIYFSAWMKERWQLFKEFLENEGVFRAFIMVVFPIVFLIVTPALIIGLFLGCVIRPLLGDYVSSPFE